ncbi:RNA polymerase sigma factor [Viridibacillus sp. YIM B01967]|uniref:RNA polymerase sigma factor n=1 Tax=Viridibacillus soli TaxID=2798301 RepID=A0ABS1HAS6_9BACL|nr:RNA polymerase sigma factor [Viridibacillus soli]MBK3496517.1 RNA polymerase sigma factor [Viridibacillus soli]
MGDKKLIKQIQQGNSDLLDVLIRKYYKDIYSFCFRKTVNSNIAADLTQEVFLKLVHYIHSYVHDGKFKNYLFTIARNVCIDYYRKNGDVIQFSEGLDAPANDENLTKVEQSEIVMQALNDLPDIQKDVVLLRFYHDMKVRDIAEITQTSLSTTKSRLKQGLDKLKKIISEEDVF